MWKKKILLSQRRQSILSTLVQESKTLIDSALFSHFLRTGPPPTQQSGRDYKSLELKMKVGSPGPVSVSFKNSRTKLNSPSLLFSAAWMWTTVQDEVELTAEVLVCEDTYIPRPIARHVDRVLASARSLLLYNVKSELEAVAVELAEAAERPGARLEELALGRLNRAEVHGAAAALSQLAPHLKLLELYDMKPPAELWKLLTTKISGTDPTHLKLERLMIACDMEEANPEDAAKLFSSIPWITLYHIRYLKVHEDVWAAFADSVVEGSNQVVPHLQLGRVGPVNGYVFTTDLSEVPEDVISRLIANLEEVTLEGRLVLSDKQWKRITEEVENKRRDGSAKLAKFKTHNLNKECKKNEFIKRINNAI